MIILTDLLRFPFDEGAKNTVYNIIKSLCTDSKNIILSINGSEGVGDSFEICNVNKAFLDVQFLTKLRAFPHAAILYVPESSATIFSIIRAKLIKFFTGKDVYVLALQPREYFGLKKLIVKFIAPVMVITPSENYSNYLREIGLNCTAIPLGVNDLIYRQYEKNEQIEIRNKYNVETDKVVLLHVGHIKKSRNLEWLIKVKDKIPDIEIIIVGSTYNKSELELFTNLEAHGVVVINTFIENMAEIYNMADYYVFPVQDDQGAIATPLSVLEAMSCNIPIITTRFGSLVDIFSSDKDFHFIDDSADIIRVLQENSQHVSVCANREKVEGYTWKNIAKKIMGIVG